MKKMKKLLDWWSVYLLRKVEVRGTPLNEKRRKTLCKIGSEFIYQEKRYCGRRKHQQTKKMKGIVVGWFGWGLWPFLRKSQGPRGMARFCSGLGHTGREPGSTAVRSSTPDTTTRLRWDILYEKMNWGEGNISSRIRKSKRLLLTGADHDISQTPKTGSIHHVSPQHCWTRFLSTGKIFALTTSYSSDQHFRGRQSSPHQHSTFLWTCQNKVVAIKRRDCLCEPFFMDLNLVCGRLIGYETQKSSHCWERMECHRQ